MALHTKKDFALICGLKPAELSMGITRRKVLCSGDYVDDSIPVNVAFMEKWRSVRNPDVPAPALNGQARPSARTVAPPDLTPVAPKAPNVRQPQLEFTYESPVNQLDLKIKETELARKEEDLEIAKLKRAKMAGEVIPVELVNNVFTVYSKSTMTAWYNATDNFLMDMQKRYGMSSADMSTQRTELIEIVNNAIEDAFKESVDSLKNIVEEYSDTRGQGDRLS